MKKGKVRFTCNETRSEIHTSGLHTYSHPTKSVQNVRDVQTLHWTGIFTRAWLKVQEYKCHLKSCSKKQTRWSQTNDICLLRKSRHSEREEWDIWWRVSCGLFVKLWTWDGGFMKFFWRWNFVKKGPLKDWEGFDRTKNHSQDGMHETSPWQRS